MAIKTTYVQLREQKRSSVVIGFASSSSCFGSTQAKKRFNILGSLVRGSTKEGQKIKLSFIRRRRSRQAACFLLCYDRVRAMMPIQAVGPYLGRGRVGDCTGPPKIRGQQILHKYHNQLLTYQRLAIENNKKEPGLPLARIDCIASQQLREKGLDRIIGIEQVASSLITALPQFVLVPDLLIPDVVIPIGETAEGQQAGTVWS